MKRTLFFLVCMLILLSSAAVRADDLTVYGIFQVEVANFSMHDRNPAKESKEDGVQLVDEDMGRIGVYATEDVSFGVEDSVPMQAIVKLEFGTNSADGDSDTAADENNELTKGIALTKRELMGALKGDFGQVEIGRLKSEYKYTGGISYDPFYATTLEARNNGGMTGNEANEFIIPFGGASVSEWGHNGFNSDMVAYRSPMMGGFSFGATYGPQKDDGSYTVSAKQEFPVAEIFAAAVGTGDRNDLIVVNNDPVSGLPVGTTTALDNKYTAYKIGGQLRLAGGAQKFSMQLEHGKNRFSWPGAGPSASPPFDVAGSSQYEVDTFFAGYQAVLPTLSHWTFVIQAGRQEFTGEAVKDDFGNEPGATNYIAGGVIYKMSKTTRLFGGTRITERQIRIPDDGTNLRWLDDGGESVFSVGFRKDFKS